MSLTFRLAESEDETDCNRVFAFRGEGGSKMVHALDAGDTATFEDPKNALDFRDHAV